MGRKSRDFFKPGVDEEGVYLHVYNRCANFGSNFPFADKEKDKFFRHLKWHLHLYAIECISAVAMSNHYHLVLYVPKQGLSEEDVFSRVKSHRKDVLVSSKDDHYCKMRAAMSNDLSSFMKEFQQSFTMWFNKSRDYRRKGTLWEQRFKCTKLADAQSLATCVQYVELNPLRAGLVKDPGKYGFSTYGKWQTSGRHPFSKSFMQHMIVSLRGYLDSSTAKGVKQYYRERFDKILKSRKSKDISPLLKRSRFWTDSLVLGGKETLREEAVEMFGKEKGSKKQFGKVFRDEECDIRSMRQLVVDV